jgi:hypothetical protein
MRALVLLEATVAKNNLLRLMRSPLRLTLWTLYIGFLLVAGFVRMHAPPHYAIASSLLSAPLASAFAGVYLAALGGSIAYHALGNVKAFRSRAEALLFVNAGLSSRTITIWLQTCKLLSLATRWIWTIALNFIIFTPNQVARGEILRGFIASIAGAALLIAIEIPAFLLGKRKFGRLFAAGAVFAAIIGVSYMLLGLSAAEGNGSGTEILLALRFDPGAAITAFLRGPPEALAAFIILPFLVSLALVPLCADAVPELFGASIRLFETFKRNRSATLGAVFEHDRRKRKQGWVPPGAFVLLWKEWLAFRRRRLAWLLWSAMFTLAFGMGAAMASLAQSTHNEADGWALLGLIGAFIFLVPLFASIGLADDVSKPLFWMTTRSLRASLFIWACARSWRGAIIVDTTLFVAAVSMGDQRAALFLPPAGATLWFSLNAMGILIYALFPNRFDEHGPLFLVRMLAVIALLAPCVTLALIATLLKQNAESVLFYVCLTLVLEALGSLEIAAVRLRYNSSGYSLSEP